ncbi:MAG: Flp family type IVb pilin [Pseudomonadota bacterium]
MTGETMNLTTFLKHIGNDNSGATAVEYGLIVSLIVIAMIGALNGVATSTIDMWDDVQTASEEAIAQN